MGHSKKFCDLCALLWKEPRIKVLDARGRDLAGLSALVRESGVVKVATDDEAECVARFVDEGATVMPQYEAVRAGQADSGVLETVAKAAPSAGDTPRSRSRLRQNRESVTTANGLSPKSLIEAPTKRALQMTALTTTPAQTGTHESATSTRSSPWRRVLG